MPIISESPKDLYINLYEELTNKNNPIIVYLKEKEILTKEEADVGEAIQNYINLFDTYKKQFSEQSYNINKKGNVEYQDMNYEHVQKHMMLEEKICEKLEAEVLKIRGALLKSVENRLEEGYDYKKVDPNDDNIPIEDRIFAKGLSVEDAYGKIHNRDYDELVKRQKESNMEFAHRPVVYKLEKNPTTGKEVLKKQERYISYEEKFSKKYRFFEKKVVKYDRSYDPDAYVLAPLALRDILQNHQEMKEECDRRREYVKFINKQHQAYAVWKEQIKDEERKYFELVNVLSKETLERYNAAMAKYDSATSHVAAVRKWLEDEHKDYIARKMVLAEKLYLKENAEKNLENQEITFQRYMEEMEAERNKVVKELEELKSNPILGQEKREADKEALRKKLEAIKTLKIEIESLSKDAEVQIKEQEKTRQELLNAQEIVTGYKEHLQKLKFSLKEENLDAVVNYFRLLRSAKLEIEKDILEKQEEMISTVGVIKRIQKESDRAYVDVINAQDAVAKEKAFLENAKGIINDLKEFTKLHGKEQKKNIANFKEIMKIAKNRCKELQSTPEEKKQILNDAAMAFAKDKDWPVSAIYMDDELSKFLNEEIKISLKRIPDLEKIYNEKKAEYEDKQGELQPIAVEITKILDAAEQGVEVLSKQLEGIQAKNVRSAKSIAASINLASDEELRQKEEIADQKESELIKNYKALEDSLQKKFAVLHEKRQALDSMMNEQEALAKVINEAEDAEKTVNEKQKELEDLIKRQETDLKDLAVRKEAAAKAWEDGDKNYTDQYEHAQKYIEEYEYIEKMFNDRDLISEQKLEDLVDYTKHQQDKLSQDAEKQKAYIREKQSKECRVIRADLLNLKQFLTEVERPKGIFKISNSRAFTELRNTMMEYLEISVMVKDPENPGQKKTLTNPSEVITLLECMDGQERFHVTDKQRTEYLTKIANAMDKMAEAADKYLKAKGSPYRETELGRARYEMACEVRAYAKKAAFKVKGMLREEQYCLDAPNLGLVTEKSGLKEADYVKVDGYRYVRGDVQREEAIMHADALMQLKDAADHDKLMDELQRAKDEKNMLIEKEQGPVMN